MEAANPAGLIRQISANVLMVNSMRVMFYKCLLIHGKIFN